MKKELKRRVHFVPSKFINRNWPTMAHKIKAKLHNKVMHPSSWQKNKHSSNSFAKFKCTTRIKLLMSFNSHTNNHPTPKSTSTILKSAYNPSTNLRYQISYLCKWKKRNITIRLPCIIMLRKVLFRSRPKWLKGGRGLRTSQSSLLFIKAPANASGAEPTKGPKQNRRLS